MAVLKKEIDINALYVSFFIYYKKTKLHTKYIKLKCVSTHIFVALKSHSICV